MRGARPAAAAGYSPGGHVPVWPQGTDLAVLSV